MMLKQENIIKEESMRGCIYDWFLQRLKQDKRSSDTMIISLKTGVWN